MLVLSTQVYHNARFKNREIPRDTVPSTTHTPGSSLPTAAETTCSSLLDVMLMQTTLYTWERWNQPKKTPSSGIFGQYKL